MPKIDVPLEEDPMVYSLGNTGIELTIRTDFSNEDASKYLHAATDFDIGEDSMKVQMTLLFGTSDKEYKEITKKINYRNLKIITSQAWQHLNAFDFIEKKMSDVQLSKSSKPSQDLLTLKKQEK